MHSRILPCPIRDDRIGTVTASVGVDEDLYLFGRVVQVQQAAEFGIEVRFAVVAATQTLTVGSQPATGSGRQGRRRASRASSSG